WDPTTAVRRKIQSIAASSACCEMTLAMACTSCLPWGRIVPDLTISPADMLGTKRPHRVCSRVQVTICPIPSQLRINLLELIASGQAKKAAVASHVQVAFEPLQAPKVISGCLVLDHTP